MQKQHIGIAMSGGVDSTVAAILLQEHYQVHGFFMTLAQPDLAAQQQRAAAIAKRLDIELHFVDLGKDFNVKVLQYCATTYYHGQTPNPCMVCNQTIKFGLLQERILAAGMTAMATGHYARISKDHQGFHLHQGDDPSKDQSYFLARLNQHQLSHLIFPLGERRKTEVFALAAAHGFDDFAGSESQDVCFLADGDMATYLDQHFPKPSQPGAMVSTAGLPLGQHRGLHHYTIGQRRGLGIPDATPWYVVAIDIATNRLILGKAAELFQHQVQVNDLHWLGAGRPDTERSYTVRLRSTHRGSLATIAQAAGGVATLSFAEAQRAITPGQYAVIYDGSELLGSAVITGTGDRP